jgi:hypothetical protein
VTRPRAADDFASIWARMEELRRDRARPRAADDFPMIRARMEELRRDRAQVSARQGRRLLARSNHLELRLEPRPTVSKSGCARPHRA